MHGIVDGKPCTCACHHCEGHVEAWSSLQFATWVTCLLVFTCATSTSSALLLKLAAIVATTQPHAIGHRHTLAMLKRANIKGVPKPCKNPWCLVHQRWHCLPLVLLGKHLLEHLALEGANNSKITPCPHSAQNSSSSD